MAALDLRPRSLAYRSRETLASLASPFRPARHAGGWVQILAQLALRTQDGVWSFSYECCASNGRVHRAHERRRLLRPGRLGADHRLSLLRSHTRRESLSHDLLRLADDRVVRDHPHRACPAVGQLPREGVHRSAGLPDAAVRVAGADPLPDPAGESEARAGLEGVREK